LVVLVVMSGVEVRVAVHGGAGLVWGHLVASHVGAAALGIAGVELVT